MESPPPETDAELLDRSRRDGRAFRELYERHVLDLHGWLLREARDEQVALELVAETFAQALASRDRFAPPDDGNARPWLWGIAKNLLRTWHRKGSVETTMCERLGVELRSREHDARELLIAVEVRNDLLRALGGLPDEQRRAIELRVLDDLPYEAVARELGCSADTARKRVTRGLDKLHDDLQGALL